MKSTLVLAVVVLAANLIAGLLFSGVAQAHGAHVHSLSSGTLAVDQGRLELRLEIPGANLVGFEHPPNDQAQSAALQQAKNRLESADWLAFDPDGQCELAARQVITQGFDEHDDHAGHAQFVVQVEAQCGRTGRLRWIELSLFEDWPDNRELKLDVLTDRIQQRFELDAENIRVELD